MKWGQFALGNRNYSVLLLVLSGVAFGLLSISAFYPFLPREGDLIACWYPYVQDWLRAGLAEALKHTDGQGKFPTQAILMIAAMKLSGQPLLDALQYMRLFCGLLSIFGFFLLIIKLGFSTLWSVVLSAIINLHPVYYGTVKLNAQDSSKPGFFMLSAALLIALTKDQLSRNAKIFAVLAISFTSSMLAMVRSVDLIPFLAFTFFWALHLKGGGLSLNWSSAVAVFKKSKSILLYAAIPTTVLFGLLLYGKSVVHHWGFSAGEAPQPWITFYYFKALKDEVLADESKIRVFAHAVFWFLNNVINKLSYFSNDYFFMSGPIKIIGVYRFVKNLELAGASLYLQVANGILGVALFVVVISQILKDLLCKKIWTVFLYSGLSGWFFWTFLLNHYEPRYWSIVFVCWSIGLLGPHLLKLSGRAETLEGWAVGLLSYLILFNFNSLTLEEIPQSSRRLAVAWKWQAMATEACKKPEDQIWIIPFNYLHWSSFRYFVEQACPRLEITCSSGNDYFCKKPENPSHKTIVDMPLEIIDPQ